MLAEEDPKNRELMAKQENGLQQLVRGQAIRKTRYTANFRAPMPTRCTCLASGHAPAFAQRPLRPRSATLHATQVLMALSDSPVVVEETCRTLTLLAEHSPGLAEAVVQNDADAIMRLLPAADEARQLSSLRLLAAIAYSSPAASARIATPQLLAALQQLVGVGAGDGDYGGGGGTEPPADSVGGSDGAPPAAEIGEGVRTAALKALGNLAFCPDNRRRLSRTPELMARLSALALRQQGPPRMQVGCLLRPPTPGGLLLAFVH